MKAERLRELLARFSAQRLLVIGDLMLDEFIWGKVSRISPEAPVPVVEVCETSYYPGGAANVARNLREFTRDVDVMGLVGRDAHGQQLKALLAEGGIGLRLVEEAADWQTIVKSRVIARQQHVVRVDRESRVGVGVLATAHERALCHLRDEGGFDRFDAVILEDYAKGFLDQAFVDALSDLAASGNRVLTVDPNPRNPLHWRGATAVKPNRAEAFSAAGVPPSEPEEPASEDRALLDVGATLLERWGPQSLLITLGEGGMMLFQPGHAPFHLSTRAREVFDLSGAGDTAIALFTLALAAGATASEAAEISNHAAGVVVGKLGTATVTPAELLESFARDQS